MAPEKQDKLMKWILLGFLALSLVPLWKFSRVGYPTDARPVVTPLAMTPKPYVFPSSETQLMQDLSGYSRIQIGSAQFAGRNSINCGSVNPYVRKQRAAADACAIAAFKTHKPFRLIYQTGGKEIINWGVAGNAKGQVFFLRNVDANNGINNYVTGETLYACKKPIIVSVKGQPRIACQEKRHLAP